VSNEQAGISALLEQALALQAAGCSVVPARADGTKAPAAFWKPYQTTRATAQELTAWLAGGEHDGFGVVCGQVSGGLEMLELEGRAMAEGVMQAYASALADHGLNELWHRIAAGYLEATPSGGLHILYRVDGEQRGNTKLASRPARDDELTLEEQTILTRKPGKVFPRVLVETRGEGGYVIVAPSAGRTHPTGKAWTVLAGGAGQIPVISEDERDALHAIASLLDTMPDQATPPPPAANTRGSSEATGIRPGDEYNAKADWADILAPHGWTHVQNFGQARGWRRPGKDRGVSATTGRNPEDRLYVFSSSTEFDCEKPYSKFAAYALLEHGGDYAAAARELGRQGYGTKGEHGDEHLADLIAPGHSARDVHAGTEGNLATVHQLRPSPHPRATSHGQEIHRGQMRFAQRFTAAHGGDYLHAHGIGWHQFDGARWAPCLDGAERRAVQALLDEAWAEMPHLDGDARKDLFKDIGKVESAAGQSGVLELASVMHPCTLAGHLLDGDPYLLNTKTGTLDLRTGSSSRPDPADHLSKVTRAAFAPEARSGVFDAFLQRVQPDPDARAFLARQLGSALLGVVREHVLFIWHGQGANGKGTLRDAILHALGDYAVEVPADLLLVTRNANLAPERMRLKGARVAYCSEIGSGAKLDEPTMKKLTGGDPVNAKLLYKNPIQFDPSHTLFMLTNHLPQVRGDDPATWRRILAIPFDTVIPAEERDGELPEKLKAEPDAIFAWLWSGWLDYQRQGLNPPGSVMAATRKYQLDSDVLARFLADEEAVVLGHGSVGSAVLYRAFVDWAKAEGEEAGMTNKAFTEAMTIRGHRKKTTSAGAVWQHIMIAGETAGREGW
jgi:putative DNA primase/helicase